MRASRQYAAGRLLWGVNRRRFLQFLFGSGATVIVAPRLILPAAPRSVLTVVRPSVQILKTEFVTREALRVLEQNLTFTRQVNRSYFHETAFVFTVPRLGETMHVRTPARLACGRFGAADD